MKKILFALLLTLVALTSVSVAHAVAGPTFAALTNSNQIAKDGVAFNLATALATQPDNGTATYAISANPTLTGLAIDASTGVISITPAVAQAGTYTVTATVSDTNSTDTLTFTLTIVNSGPILNTISDQIATEGTAFSYQTTLATAADNGPVTYSIVSSTPAIASLSINAAGKITTTATHSEIGDHTVIVGVKDADNVVKTKQFKLTVQDSAPTLDKITAGAKSWTFQNLGTTGTINTLSGTSAKYVLVPSGTPFIATVSNTDAGTNYGDSITYTHASEWAAFSMTSGGTITVTPTDDDAGMHYITITSTDASGSQDIKTIRFYVTPTTDDGKLQIASPSVDIKNNIGDDSELNPTDGLTVAFDVKNAMSQTITNIKAKVWLEDSAMSKKYSNKQSIDVGDLDSLSTSDNQNTDIVVTDNAKDSGTTDPTKYYLVHVEISGDDESGATHTGTYFEEVRVMREDHRVVIKDITLAPTSPTCNGPVEFAIKTTNIGKANDESVKLNVHNARLDANVDSSSFTLKNSGTDSSAITKVNVNLPASAKADSYSFDVKAIYNDGKSDVVVSKAVPVTCETVTASNTTATSAISVAESSQTVNRGEAGKYTITLTNTQATQQAFKVTISGVADWATVTVENGDVTLAPGASAPAYIYVTPNSNAAAGLHLATVAINAGSTLLDTKTLTTTVAVPTTTVTDYSKSATVANSTPIDNGTLMNVGFAALFIIVVVLAVGLFWVRNGKGKAERY